jgi:glutamate formiminotransferase/glutamate formiminotransferase/formiminotetrahydrofolate cyclodeaminase
VTGDAPDQIVHTLHRSDSEVKTRASTASAPPDCAASVRSNLVTVRSPILLAVPNVSEGRDHATIERIGAAFAASAPTLATPPTGDQQAAVCLLDVHSDADHHRSVFTLAGRPSQLVDALFRGAAAAVESIDVIARASGASEERGAHPHVGAIDVVPLVYFDPRLRGAACATALVVAEQIGEQLGVPVFLYGELAGGRPGATRAELRRGGIAGLAARLARADASGQSADADADTAPQPDFGPRTLHPSAGATLLAAREPLVAFNLQLRSPATLTDARRIAALVREGGEHGLPGLRAIGIELDGAVAQVSMNVERPFELPLYEVVLAVQRHAAVASAELVGLAPRAAFDGFPGDLPMPGFEPARHLIENALAAVPPSENASDENALGC